jgi:tetratricopeptide (TPR) repeat protein
LPPETHRVHYRKSAHAQGFDHVTTSHSNGFSAQLHNYVGLIYTRLQKYTAARLAFDKAIEKAIELDSSAVNYYVNRALLKQAVNDSTYQQDFERASQLNPNHVLISANKALFQQTDNERENFLAEAIAKEPLMANNYIQRGYLRPKKKITSVPLKILIWRLRLRKMMQSYG